MLVQNATNCLVPCSPPVHDRRKGRENGTDKGERTAQRQGFENDTETGVRERHRDRGSRTAQRQGFENDTETGAHYTKKDKLSYKIIQGGSVTFEPLSSPLALWQALKILEEV